MNPQKNSDQDKDLNADNSSTSQPQDTSQDQDATAASKFETDNNLSLADEKSSQTPTPVVNGAENNMSSPKTPNSEEPSPSTESSPIWPHESFADSTSSNSSTPGQEMPVMPTVAPGRSRKKKLGLLALIVGIVVVVLGASAAAYFAYYLPAQPDNILKSALANSFSKDKVSSVNFEGEVNVKDTENQAFSVGFKGVSGQQGQLDVTAEIDAMLTTITMDVRSIDGKTFYAKVGGLEGLPELLSASGDQSAASYAPLLSTINNQWYEINASLLQEVLGASLENGLFTDEDRQKLVNAYEQHPFLKVQETLPDEQINGRDSYHYKVAIDNAKLKDFMSALQASKLSVFTLSQEMVNSFNESISKTDFSKYPVEVWIAKDSKMFTQFKQTVQEGDTTTDIRLTITDYNKTITVEKPEGAKSILEAITPLMQSAQESLESLDQSLLESIESDGSAGDVSL